MTDAETILKMIETVDPTNTAKLDEIDARVQCWRMGHVYSHHDEFCSGLALRYMHKDNEGKAVFMSDTWKYTRSRDALKAIRTDGWWFGMYQGADGFTASCEKPDWFSGFRSPRLPTEELAELHSIIQAIEYERSK